MKKDKYYFVEASVQHLFDFPTYIVTKLYEEYHEDYLVVENNLDMSGGLFKSPTQSPVHQLKQKKQIDGKSKPRGLYSGRVRFDFGRVKETINNNGVIPEIQIMNTSDDD